VIVSVNRCQSKASASTRAQLSRDIDVLIRHPNFVEEWSLPLSSFDPVHNSFRDLLFIYN
jgi:hypothetical protein